MASAEGKIFAPPSVTLVSLPVQASATDFIQSWTKGLTLLSLQTSGVGIGRCIPTR